MNLLENQMVAMIMTAFPQYKEEEIEAWTLDRLAKIFAMAEWSLRQLRGVPIEIQTDAPSMPLPPNPAQVMKM